MGETPANLPANAINLLNKTSIAEMIALIRAADFVVSVDSGPMHIAAATGHSAPLHPHWSDPRLVGPFNEKAWIWQNSEIRRQRLDEEGFAPGRAPDSSEIKKKWPPSSKTRRPYIFQLN